MNTIDPAQDLPSIQVGGKEIKPLTAFRFFAALAVFLVHLSSLAERDAQAFDLRPYFGEGYVGVVFFFILSGFILTFNYHSKLLTFKLSELERFFVARVARIYPVHLLTFLVALLLAYPAVDFQGDGIKALLNLSLLQAFVPDRWSYWSFNAPSWSLSAEMFFYALLPVLLALLVRVRGTSLRRALGLLLGLWALVFAFVWVIKDAEPNEWITYISPYLQFSNFLAGVLLCYVFLNLKKLPLLANLETGKWDRLLFTLLELVALGGLLIALYFYPVVHLSFRRNIYYAPFFCLIVLIFAFQKGYVSALLSSRLAVLLGEISFAFYMFHRLVLVAFDKYGLFDMNAMVGSVAAFLVSVIVSYICYRFYEVPARTQLRHILRLNFSVPVFRAAPGEAGLQPERPRATLQDRLAGRFSLGSRFLLPPNQALFGIGSVIVVASVVGVTYFQTLRFGFTDGIWNLFDAVQRLDLLQYVSYALDPRVQILDYHPLQKILFLGEYLVFGSDLSWFRVARLLIHLADVLVFCWVLFRITHNRKIALVSAILMSGLAFYAEPMLDLMNPQPEAGLFYLLCVVAWISFLQSKQLRFKILALVMFALALLGKETSATLLVALVVVDRFFLRRTAEPTQWFRYYFPFLLLLVGDQMLELPVFSSAPDTFLIFVWVPISVMVLAFFGLGEYGTALLYSVVGVLLIGWVMLSSVGEMIPVHGLEIAAILLGSSCVLLSSVRAARSGRRVYIALAALAIGFIVFVNGNWVANASADWNETVRQRRVPFHDIALLHARFPSDTYLYFIDPPAFRDLSGLVLWQYGRSVSVGSSSADYSLNTILYPSLERLGASIPTKGGVSQPAGLRDHAVTFVYYFDSSGKPIEVAVDKSETSSALPSLPADFVVPIRFEGYEMSTNSLQPGDTLVLLLYWSATQGIDKDYTVFVHLMDNQGNLIDGYDSQPRHGSAPTTSWEQGKMIVDPIVFPIPPDIPTGEYRLEIGLYFLPTLQRLSLANGFDHFVIEPIQIVQ